MAKAIRRREPKTHEDQPSGILEECQDCLIWVGSGSYGTVARYVKEAETRGCCRRIPNWPSWAKPGETRVFLAHRDAFRRPDRGVIFGYFVLHGVDIILDQKDCDDYKRLKAECGNVLNAEQDPELSRSFAKTPEGKKCLEPIVDFWRKKLDKRLPFNNPPKPGGEPGPADSENDVVDFVLDFLLCGEPEGIRYRRNGYGISAVETALEEERWCGLRPYGDEGQTEGQKMAGPAIYFVDALTRTIDERFCELVKELIKAALEKAKKKKRGGKTLSLTEKEDRNEFIEGLAKIAAKPIPRSSPTRQKGIPEFADAVKEASRSRVATKVPLGLKDIAQPRGELVLFNKPYPFFQKAPKAAFQALLRIDGNQLLNQIVRSYKNGEGSRKLEKLPYCPQRPHTRGKPRPEDQLVLELAQALGVSQHFAGRIMDEFADLIARDLRGFDAIRLNRIGTFRIRAKNGRRLVKFKVSTLLKSGVATAPATAAPKTARKGYESKKALAGASAYQDSRGTRSSAKRTK